MKTLSALALISLLSACGADGPPVAPSQAAGVAATGSVQVGVVGGN